jgi:DUF1680 family protein
MKATYFLGLLLAAMTACTAGDGSMQSGPAQAVSFTRVRLTDNFWAPRIETNRAVSIPSAFRQCEINGRFHNFALAAGTATGEQAGDFPFDDTDPYKIIEGASYTLSVKWDPQLDAYLDSIISIIASAQEPDGYLTTCVTNRSERLKRWWGSERWEKINSHELYNSGHLYEAAVAHYQATGKRSLLDVAIRNADLVCSVFGPSDTQKHVPSGHPIIEMALVKLYNVTGNRQYLSQARYFIEETGRGTDGHTLNDYSQDHKPILEQDEILGHAVRAGYLFSGVVDMAVQERDTAYLDAAIALWDNMANQKLYVTGGIGSQGRNEGFGEPYDLPNHTAYCETCASIANVYWNHRLFLATGDARYADLLERTLYNALIAGVSLSGDLFFYDNPLASKGDITRQAWFGCACCPGNITRFMASIPGYMYAVNGSSLYVNLYATSTAQVEINGKELRISQQTDYPWDGKISIRLQPKSRQSLTLMLRIPGWASDTPQPGSDLYAFTAGNKPSEAAISVRINGEELPAVQTVNGYLPITRSWSDNDIVELSLPMDIRRILAHPKVEADRGQLAIQRGPIIYCLESIDQPDKEVFNKYIPADAAMTFRYDPTLLNGSGLISGRAQLIRPKAGRSETAFSAIPYALWDNRGRSQMSVWMPATPTPPPPPPLPAE